jgi:hypothetical protein
LSKQLSDWSEGAPQAVALSEHLYDKRSNGLAVLSDLKVEDRQPEALTIKRNEPAG